VFDCYLQESIDLKDCSNLRTSKVFPVTTEDPLLKLGEGLCEVAPERLGGPRHSVVGFNIDAIAKAKGFARTGIGIPE
jgi:hypothetical protein